MGSGERRVAASLMVLTLARRGGRRVAAEARAGERPITATSKVLQITPNAMPSAPSISWAKKPTATKIRKSASHGSIQWLAREEGVTVLPFTVQ